MLPSSAVPANNCSTPPTVPLLAQTLLLCPPLEPVLYQAVCCWETYAGGAYKPSTVTKQVALSGRQLAEGDVELDFRSCTPALTKPTDQESLETLALRLAVLYQQVIVRAAPTGAFLELLNHAALRQTWAQLAQELQEATTADDQLTATLIQFMSQQLQSPVRVLHSLRYDYLYAALVPNLFALPMDCASPTARTREFAQFFDKQALFFAEQVQVLEPAAEATVTVACRGTVDAQRTDVAAIGRLMAQAVSQPADAVVVPHFHYAATHVLDVATGLPQRVDLTVYGRLAAHYNKQYTLTLTRA